MAAPWGSNAPGPGVPGAAGVPGGPGGTNPTAAFGEARLLAPPRPRRRGAGVLVGLLVVAVIGGLVAGGWLLLRSSGAEDAATVTAGDAATVPSVPETTGLPLPGYLDRPWARRPSPDGGWTLELPEGMEASDLSVPVPGSGTLEARLLYVGDGPMKSSTQGILAQEMDLGGLGAAIDVDGAMRGAASGGMTSAGMRLDDYQASRSAFGRTGRFAGSGGYGGAAVVARGVVVMDDLRMLLVVVMVARGEEAVADLSIDRVLQSLTRT